MYSPLESLKMEPRFPQGNAEYDSALAAFNAHAQKLPAVFALVTERYFDAQQAGLDGEISIGKMGLLLKGHRRLFLAHKNPNSLKGWRERSESKKTLHRLLLQYEIDRDGMKDFDVWLKEYEKNVRAVYLAENKVEISQQSLGI